MTTRLILLVILAVALQATGVYADAPAVYHAIAWDINGSYTDLGTLSGGTDSRAYGNNEYGQITGSATNAAGVGEAVRWDASGAIVDLGAGSGFAINDLGQVAGVSDGKAVFWDANGSRHDIGTGFANDVNNSGQVAGTLMVTTDAGALEAHAFIWSVSDGLADLGKLMATVGSTAQSINDQGSIAGCSLVNNDHGEAFFRIPGKDWVIVHHGTATGINGAGQVVGNSLLGEGFIWTSGVGCVPIGMTANALNETGIVAGTSFANNAAYWTSDGGVTEFAALAGSIRSAGWGINNQGQVVGWAMYVPEPSAAASLFLGLCGLVPVRLLRRARAASR